MDTDGGMDTGGSTDPGDGTDPGEPGDGDVTTPPGSTAIGSIGDLEVAVGSKLSLVLAATELTSSSLLFSASPLPLPDNTVLDTASGSFTFTPDVSQVGSFTLTFSAMGNRATESAAIGDDATVSETVRITVPALAGDGVTTLTGKVLDSTTTSPLARVKLTIGDITTTTDESGGFVLAGVGGEIQSLMIDGADVSGGAYPTLKENVTLIEGATNVMPRAIFLPALDLANADPVDPAQTSIVDSADVMIDGTMFKPIVLTIPPGTAMNAETGTPFDDAASITIVREDRGPLPLPDGIDASLYITVQPFNMVFDPPAPISFPNVDGFNPGATVDIFGLNRETGEFEKVGTGTVSADGTTVDSDGGVVTSGSWHATVPPRVIIDEDGRRILVIDRPWQKKKHGSSAVGIRDGSLSVDYELPGIRSLNETANLSLIYNSATADPRPVINFDVNNGLRGPIPTSISATLCVAGLDQGEVFTDGSGMPFNSIEPFRQAFQIDGSQLPTGLYSYEMRVICNFPQSRRQAPPINGQVVTVNEQASPFGAGWTLSGLSRLFPQADQSLLLVEGDGSATLFVPEPTGDNGLNLALFDTPNAFEAVTNGFEGLVAEPFTVTTADETSTVTTTVVSVVNFPDGDFDRNAFFNVGPDGVPDANSQEIAPAGDDISIQPPGDNESFGASFSGFLFLPEGGDVTFTVGVDDSFDLIVNGTSVVQFLSGTDFQEFVSEPINLPAGVVPLMLNYSESTGEANIVLSAAGGGLPGGVIPQRFLFTTMPDLTVTPTTFVPAAGIDSAILSNADRTFALSLPSGSSADFDATGLLTAQTDSLGNSIRYSYDGSDRVSTIVYPTNQTFTLAYDGGGLSSITDPGGRVTAFVVLNDHLNAITNPEGKTVSYEYDASHRLTKLTTARGSTYVYAYDGNGMVHDITLPNGEVRRFAPSQSFALPSEDAAGSQAAPLALVNTSDIKDTATDGMGAATTYETDRLGSVLKETDSEGRVTDITRGTSGRISRLVKRNGSAVNLTHDARGNVLSINEEADGGTLNLGYDGNGDLVNISTPMGRTYQLGYDQDQNLVSFTDAMGTISKQYDAMGQPVTVTDALGESIQFGYDANGNLTSFTDESGHVTSFTLDDVGNVTELSDEGGQTATYTYDSMNRPLTMTNENQEATAFAYDEQGNLMALTDARGGVTRFSYDMQGLETSMTDPLGGVTQYAYDRLQNRTSLTRPDGKVVTYTYDSLSRRTGMSLPDGNQVVYEFNAFSGLSRAADSDSELRLTHNDLGALIAMAYGDPLNTAVVDPPATLAFAYDLDSNMTSRTAPDGKVTSIAYDDRSVVSGLSNSGISHAITYDAILRLTGIATTVAGGASSDMARTYTPTHQLMSLVNRVEGATISQFDITIDAVGNRTRITDDSGSEHAYVYDAAGRLLSATHPNQPAESYTYDAVGNRLTSHFDAGPAQYDAANRIVSNSAFVFTHDPNGNLSSKTDNASGAKTNYKYDALNQLIEVETLDGGGARTALITYTYNPIGKRTSKNIDGTVTKYVWNPRGEMVAEYDGNDALLATYFYGAERQMLLSMERGGQQYVYHRDCLGGIIQITDSVGAVISMYSYDSYGRPLSTVEGVSNPFRFAGAQYDPETGLYYMNARFYDPQLGRFLQPDPYAFIGSGPNLYAYVKNNPVNFTDPTGLLGVGAIAGVGINLAGQGIDSATDKKGDFKFSWGSLVFDGVLGAVTCGLGSGFQAGKLATKAPRLASAFSRAANSGVGKFIQHPAGNAAIASFGKDALVNGKIDGNTIRDFALGAGFNRLGGRVAKDFGRDELLRDALVNGGMLATELLKQGAKDSRGRKLLDPRTGGLYDFEVRYKNK